MSDALATAGGVGAVELWTPREESIPPDVLSFGMQILSANYKQPMDVATITGYRMVLRSVRPEDFMAGIELVMRTQKFLTAAALFENCEAARVARESEAARVVREEEERQEAVALAAWQAKKAVKEARIAAILSVRPIAPTAAAEAVRLRLELERPSLYHAVEDIAVDGQRIRLTVKDGCAGLMGLYIREVEFIACDFLGITVRAELAEREDVERHEEVH